MKTRERFLTTTTSEIYRYLFIESDMPYLLYTFEKLIFFF